MGTRSESGLHVINALLHLFPTRQLFVLCAMRSAVQRNSP